MKKYLIILLFIPATYLVAQDPSCKIFLEVQNLQLAEGYRYEVSINLKQKAHADRKVKTRLLKSEKGKGVLIGYFRGFCYPSARYNPHFYLTISRILIADSLAQNTRPVAHMTTLVELVPGSTFISVKEFQPGLGYAEMFEPDENSDNEDFRDQGHMTYQFMDSRRVVIKPMAPGRIYNNAHLDDSFKAFENKLIQAVYNQDTILLNTLLAEEIEDGLMDFNSKQEFIKVHDGLWNRLKKILEFGFHRGYGSVSESFNDTTRFTAPSYFKSLKTANGSGMNRIFILDHDLLVRAKPDSLSEVVGQLTYEMVEPYINDNMDEVEVKNQQQIWMKIKLSDGRSGFVPKKYTSEYQYDTLVITKIDGDWKITTFHGDTRDW